MPLPSNGPISLQGHSRPGDTVQSKPKQAMIVRMSTETLEALEGFPHQPQMDFEFGSNPGIYIGNTFFPMRSLKEGSPHDLYLRASSAAKPMAPLKLYANVTGKFTVERELDENIVDKIRNHTLVADKQRAERKAILLETPPPTATKRKGTSSLVKKATQSDHLRHASSSSASRALPPPTSSARDASSEHLRKNVLMFISIVPRTTDELIEKVVGLDGQAPQRRDVLDVLKDVAELTPQQKGETDSPRKWQLKPRSWLEVRPYEWSRLDETERTSVSRQARYALKSLKVPETDPAWSHVRYRSGPSSGTATPSTAASSKNTTKTAAGAAQKRGVSSKEVKERKAEKARTDVVKAKMEVMMKDESMKPSKNVVSGAKRKEMELSAADAKQNARRLPGSGFKVSKTSSQDSRSDSTDSQPLAGKVSTGPVDARTLHQRDPPAPSLPARPAPPIPPPIKEDRIPSTSSSSRIKKVKGSPVTRIAESDREKTRDSDREKVREREREREAERDSVAVVGAKRKKPTREAEDSAPSEAITNGERKRRKTDPTLLSAPPTSKDKPGRDLSLPRKPVIQREPSPQPRQKIKKEYSPLPPTRQSTASPTKGSAGAHGASSSHSSHTSRSTKVNGSSKPRRRSPIYTSSEEDQVSRPVKRESHSATIAGATTHRPRASIPLPTDRASLRARYNSLHAEYIEKHQKVLAQKHKIETMLSSGSTTDSEGDVELMDAEELGRLYAERQAMEEELKRIRYAFVKSGSGSVSD